MANLPLARRVLEKLNEGNETLCTTCLQVKLILQDYCAIKSAHGIANRFPTVNFVVCYFSKLVWGTVRFHFFFSPVLTDILKVLRNKIKQQCMKPVKKTLNSVCARLTGIKIVNGNNFFMLIKSQYFRVKFLLQFWDIKIFNEDIERCSNVN